MTNCRPILSIAIVLTICTLTAQSFQVQQDFIDVKGPTLSARMESAIKAARSRPQIMPFWMGYSFNVRPGVSIGAYDRQSKKGAGIPAAAPPETRNVGVFLLHDPDRNSITRLELYNLDRRNEFGGHPVYWLGRAENNESIKLLQSIITDSAAPQVAEQITSAIALHDGTDTILAIKELLLGSSNQKARTTAAFWYGQVSTDTSLLAQLVRNDKEYTELRKQAAFSLGVSKDKNSLNTLQDLYNAVANREVKEQIIFAASINEAKDQSIDFLLKIAQAEPDREMRKRALFWLGQKAGEKSLQGLRAVTTSSDADADVQTQAVFAISQRPANEAVPALINLAKIHPNPEIRKQAIFWLSQTGDERALEFFKQLLAK
ncbi:MAG TPA: HEAT repeat domain-containing protein [Pyrinomonadaceae bacterium]|nr:HEAT repeat domain-containing protein [Pyrinomonadaceae bacterium]